MILLFANRAGRTRFVPLSAAIAFLAASATATLADIGIAARYPGDKNIGSDPAVIVADDFETYSTPNDMLAKWTKVVHPLNMRIATEASTHYAGAKGLEMQLPIATTEVSNSIIKTLSPEQDTVFIRVFAKFNAGYSVSTSNHNGVTLSGKHPGAGIKAPTDGTVFFLFLMQDNVMGTETLMPGRTHVYAYWPKMRTNYGDHWYPGGSVIPAGEADQYFHRRAGTGRQYRIDCRLLTRWRFWIK